MTSARRLLEALSYDGLEANFSCILALAPPRPGPYAEALEALEAELAARPGAGGARALKGKALLNLGRHEEARRELERSLAEEPEAGGARAWLASAELHGGRFASAESQASLALARDAGDGWARFYLAAALLASGRAAEGERELGLVSAPAEARLAAGALVSLLRSQAGSFEEALRAFEPVARARPKAGWCLALRARLHKALGDKAACLRDLDAAVACDPAAWILLDRSRVFEELGDLQRALDDVNAAMAVDGPSADLLRRRAHLQVCRRHYHLAIPDLTAAIRLNPAASEPYLERAMVQCIRENLAEAVADAALAEKASGGAPAVSLERLRMQIYAGKTAGVSRELAALSKAAPGFADQAVFLSGCLKLKTRAYADAAVEFGRAGAGDRRASFFRTIAAGLSSAPARPKARPAAARLLILGLGIKPPYTVGLETLRAISSCDFVFNNLSEPEIAGMLRLLSTECRPTMFDVRGADARWTRTIFKEVRPGRTVGFVTRGHPLVCGGLACSLIEECVRRGVEYEILGSVSSMDTLAIETMPVRDTAYPGTQVLDYSSVFNEEFRLDTRLPAVIYFNSTAPELSKKDHLRFCAALEKSYSASQPCWFYGRSFHVKPDLIRLSDLRGRHGKIDSSFTLLLPPKGALAPC